MTETTTQQVKPDGTAISAYTPSHSGGPCAWRARIMRGKRVVWVSSETFKNRDETTTYARAARDVASQICSALNNPSGFAERLEWQATFGSKYPGAADRVAFMRWVQQQAAAIAKAQGVDHA